MSEYISELKFKYGYSEELSNFLSQLLPVIINYYGEEYKDVILSALSNCEIHFQSKEEDTKEYLNSYFGVNKEWKMPSLAGAFYHNEIDIRNNQIVSKPIVYVKTVFYRIYMPFDFNSDKQVSTLIHEICHLIKGYGKLKTENGKIIDSTGLMRVTYKYSQENGILEEKNDMVGIEEALNDVETAQILEMMTGRKQEVNGYKAAGYSATRLLEHSDLAKVIRISQFRGDDTWIKYLGEKPSKLLIENFDILVNAMYVSFSDINTKAKREAFYNKMGLAQDVIDEFVDNYCSREDVDAFIQSLSVVDKKTIEMIQQMSVINQNTEEVSSSIKR